MERQEWLGSLKEGDKVAIRHYGLGASYSIRTITRITPKRIIKVGTYEYNNRGQQRGLGKWDRGADIEPITQEIMDYVEKQKLLREISDTKFNTLSLEKLREITAIIRRE